MKKHPQYFISRNPRGRSRAGMTIGIDLGDVWSHYCTINEEGRSLTALMQEGLVWGAIDFGGGSGDVMHFDCRRGISDC